MDLPTATSEFERSLTPREPSPVTSAELSAALRRDRAELHRGVIAWQFPFRLAIAGALALAAALAILLGWAI